MMRNVVTLLPLLLIGSSAFVSQPFLVAGSKYHDSSTLVTQSAEASPSSQSQVEESTSFDPKDVVKLFGRLAEKYIMLDDSGGMCCYSACSDCEYRLPDGGYRMADQSAARPKWIPVYEERKFDSLDKQHTSAWSQSIFPNKPCVDKEEFVQAIIEMDFSTPLGGPFVSKSAGTIDDEGVVEHLFQVLTRGEKDVLTKHRMSMQLKELSSGDQGLTWQMFEKAMMR